MVPDTEEMTADTAKPAPSDESPAAAGKTDAEDGATQVTMTLTTPMCPAAEELPPEVETKTRGVPGVTSVQLDLVWDPPWSPEMMSDAAKLDLGMI